MKMRYDSRVPITSTRRSNPHEKASSDGRPRCTAAPELVLKSDDITNTDVKAAAVAAGDSAQALADFAKTVGSEPSADQMTEAMDLYTTFTTSMSSLETVCNAN